ncbi:MAG: aldo/keto reductase [Magnetospirillum sp.]|nr:aldo/keto reductase [Magnetospirillum sp.]
MDVRPLGNTGIDVSILGFGGAPLGDLYARLDEVQAVGAVEAAARAGVTLFDTSPLYGHGMSELRVGAGLRRAGATAPVICTKVGRVMDPFARKAPGEGYVGGLSHRARFDYSRDGALRSIEQSLLRLGAERLDIVLIHDVDVWTHGPAAIDARFAEAVSGAYAALADLRAQGVVRAIGVGVNEADMCVRFARECDIDCVLLAGRYSLLERPAAADFLPLALRRGIGVMLGGVFNSGILATGAIPGATYNYRPAPPDVLAKTARIETVCRRHGVDLRDAAQRFVLGHAAVSCVVLGAVSAAEVDAQIAAFAAPIPPALWAELKSEGLLEPDCPVPA